MTMSWNDRSYAGGGESRGSIRSSRPSRPTYVPPHLRNTATAGGGKSSDAVSVTVTIPEIFNPFGYRPHATSSSSHALPIRRFNRYGQAQAQPSPGRGRGSRGRLWVPPRELRHQRPRGQRSTSPSFDTFDELEVIDDYTLGGNAVVDGGASGNSGREGINFDAYEDIPVETSGLDVPAPVHSFAEIDLGKALEDNIRRCKYVKPTPIQRHAIPVAMAGRDLMACAQTGSGKTAAFCFPIISGILRVSASVGTSSIRGRCQRVAYPLALILSPTRELSCQIHEEAKKFSYQTGLKVVVAYGGAPIVQQFRNLEKGVDILVATPGRLVDMIERLRVSLSKIKYLALDEADRMLDMGFEPQIRRIVEQMEMPPPGARQTMLFSATFPTEIQKLASDFLSNYIFLSVGRIGSSTDLIVQKVEFVRDGNKRNHLLNILRAQRANGTYGKHALILVFVETKRGADALEHWLSVKGFPAIAIHGDKVQVERERALRSFKNGVTPILVATDVAARGLDIPHVAHVINFDLPRDIDDYVHRIGRTGRAGKSGLATAFFSDKNLPLARALVELMQEANQEIPPWLFQNAESCGFGGGRANRFGGGRFGGHDFRGVANSKAANYDYSSQYADYSGPHAATPCSFTSGADYSDQTDPSLYGAASSVYGF